MVVRVAKIEKKAFELHDDAILAETYYRWLSHLLDEGELPDDADPQRTAIERAHRAGQKGKSS